MAVKRETLCWHCRKVGKSLCPWDASRGTVPTPGWTAIPAELYIQGKTNVISYTVLDCPLKDIEDPEDRRGYNSNAPTCVNLELFEQMVRDGYSIYQIARKLNISETTVSRRKKELKEKENA